MEVRTALLPSLPPLGAGFPAAHPTLPYTPPHHQHPHPLASLTSHFDGHGLLGANKVDDLLMGTRGDGIPIDPDNLVPYLAINKRNKHQVEGVSSSWGWAGSPSDAPGPALQERGQWPGLPARNLDVRPGASSQPTHPPSVPGWWHFQEVFLPCVAVRRYKTVSEGHRDWVAEVGGELKALYPHSGVPFTPRGHCQALESK